MVGQPSSSSVRQALSASVQSAIDAGRIGDPVFVRWTARITEDQQASAVTGEALAAISQWFASPAEQIHQCGESPLHALTHARWPRGQAALISVEPCLAGGRPGVDLMLLGTRGAIYHDGQAVRRMDIAY